MQAGKRWATAVALALFAAVALAGCRIAEFHPVTESDLVGSWQHEFDDGSRAVVVLNADGSARLVDVPAVVFLPPGQVPESSQIDWSNRVTSDATWTYAQRPLAHSYPSFTLRLSGESHTAYSPLIQNLSLPLRLQFWYGTYDDALIFERVE